VIDYTNEITSGHIDSDSAEDLITVVNAVEMTLYNL